MAFCARTGIHKGTIIEGALSVHPKNNLPQYAIQFSITQYFEPPAEGQNAGTWYDVTDEQSEIRHFLFLVKKDGNPNEISCREIMATIGWDGKSIAALAGLEVHGVEAIFLVEDETYNGQTNRRVKRMAAGNTDPAKLTGGALQKADADTVKKMAAQFDSKLRATLGGANAVGGPPPKAPAPAPPPLAASAANEDRLPF